MDQFGPLQMVMLMPDLVLAAALEFERYGLMQMTIVAFNRSAASDRV